MSVRLDDLNTLHAGLFGWPTDHLTPLDELMNSASFQEATAKLLNTARARGRLWDQVPLWPEDKWVCTEYEQLRIWVNLHDSFVSRGVLIGDWEREEVAFMLSRLRPGDAMLDIGANVGVYALQAARAVGEHGRVHCFEPQADVFRMLSRSVADNGFAERCVLHDFALGDRDGAASIWRHHEANPGASFLTTRDVGTQGNVTEVRRLDSLAFERPISFVKIDIEGYEPLLMAGGEGFFRRHRPVILTEWFPRSMREIAHSSSRDYFEMLSGFGYAVHRLEGAHPGRRLLPDSLAQFEDIEEPFNIVCLPDQEGVQPLLGGVAQGA